ncbi:ATP-dependent DNA helicase [uncultured Cetobacterium sp.]|uniref:ATP-dependent DNA helicase n=1 Tax=uncultured Cetobacterium sp. TaxID=527638 RepID=UPI0025F4242D|nr:ATP-dependent DNA helicase [uncultured Cetobacterium sp.]
MSLNKSQKEAVQTIEGPLLIIAGPGSGKTKTLVERMVYMIKEKNIKPEEILISTFTERAARELSTRVINRLKDENFHIEGMYIGTLHSICLKIIDENIELCRLKKGYRVLDNVDQKFFIFSKLKYFKNIDGFKMFFEKKEYLTNWKIGEILIKWFNKFSEEGLELTDDSFLSKAYRDYEKMLEEENVIDFSSIQKEAFRVLKNNEVALKAFTDKIKYIMIDEYQDTNTIQEKLIFLIAGETQNICVVGDDDQGIYRFRGATIRNILQFEERVGKECKLIKLEVNYRSEKDIVRFCKDWIHSLYWDKFRHSKELVVPEEKDEDKTRVVRLSVEDSESKWQERVANFLIFLKNSKKIDDYNQVAFLFRSVRNKRIISLAHYLEYRGIGVYSPRSNLFFSRDEIIMVVGVFLYILSRPESKIYNNEYKLDILDYYKKCLNVVEKKIKSDELFKDEINQLKEQYKLERNNGALLELYYKIIGLSLFKERFENKAEGVLGNRELYNFGIFSKIVQKADQISGVLKIKNDNILKVGDYFFTMHLKFLKQNGVDEYEDIKEYAPKGAVSFLTIHQSKGLEFPIVIVGSLESVPEGDREEDEELEKRYIPYNDFEPDYRIKDFDFWRLYYTAFSRAKNLLVLTAIESNKGKRVVPSLPFKRVYESTPDILSGDLKFGDLEIEVTNSIHLKESYSYTGDLLKYKECPYKYRLNKILDFQNIRTIDNFYGTLVHETLESLNKSILKKEVLDETLLYEEYLEIYETMKKRDNLLLSKEILEKGFLQVLNYYRSEFVKRKFRDVEKNIFALRKDYTIEGTVDLIVEEDEGLKIIDFKTGSDELSEEIMNKYIEQIKLYCYLLSVNTTEKVVGGEIYFIKNNKIIEVDYSLGDEDKVLKEFDTISERISKGEFSEKSSSKEKCLKCEFKNHCFGINMI